MNGEQRRDAERMSALRDEIDAVGDTVPREVDPGIRAVTIAVAMVVLLVTLVLPWVGPYSGLEILRGTTAPGSDVGVLPRLFGGVAVGFGVVLSVLTLVTRRWGLVWASAFGCAYGTLDGVWSIWSRQTVEGAGPGYGMVLASVAMLVLTVQWFKLAVTRD